MQSWSERKCTTPIYYFVSILGTDRWKIVVVCLLHQPFQEFNLAFHSDPAFGGSRLGYMHLARSSIDMILLAHLQLSNSLHPICFWGLPSRGLWCRCLAPISLSLPRFPHIPLHIPLNPSIMPFCSIYCIDLYIKYIFLAFQFVYTGDSS